MAPPDGATPNRGGVIRVHKPQAEQWTNLPNALLRDARLSFRARGALAWMLSHEDGYLVGTEQLHAHANEGREAIRTVLRELRDAGYLAQRHEQDEKGRWRTVTEVFATSTTGAQEPAPGDGFPGAGSPGAGFLGAMENDQENEQEKNHDDSAREPARLRAVPAPTLADAVGTEASTDVRAKVDRLADALDDEFLGWQHGAVANAVMEDEAGVVALVEHARAHGRNGGYVAQACRRGRHVGFAERAATPAESPRDRKRREANEAAARFLAKATRWQA